MEGGRGLSCGSPTPNAGKTQPALKRLTRSEKMKYVNNNN